MFYKIIFIIFYIQNIISLRGLSGNNVSTKLNSNWIILYKCSNFSLNYKSSNANLITILIISDPPLVLSNLYKGSNENHT